jgi:uncharacterized OB-fold protein
MTENRPFSDDAYHRFLSEERLMGSRCRGCGAAYLPPKPICTQCFGKDMEWTEMPQTGKLAAFTCITVGPPAMVREGFNRKNPYCSGVVEVDDGVRVDARIEGVDARKPESIRVGMTMRADFLHRERDGVRSTVLAYRPGETDS